MEWSSPVRKSHDGNALPPLPNEIYTEIFNYIRFSTMAKLDEDPSARRCLRCLSLVCRFFCATVAPWLFQNVFFDGNINLPAERPSTSDFCRKLLAGDENAELMAQYVKRCEFLSWTFKGADNNWLSKRILAIHTESLIRMPNIEELCLTTTTITKDLLKSISKLQKLSTLNICRCTIAPDVKSKHLQKLSSLKLRHVSFDCDMLDDIHQHINLDTVLYLKLGRWPISPQFSGLLDTLPLETLDIFDLSSEGVPRFGAFLSKVPWLKSLRITTSKNVNYSQIQVNDHSIPRLSTIKGPSYLGDLFGPGRPLASVEVFRIEENTLKYLKESACPISRVSIMLDNYCDIPLWKYFPELEALEVKFSAVPNSYGMSLKGIDTFINSWPRHPKVKYLHIETRHRSQEALDLSEQRKLLSRLLPYFPTLRLCSFEGLIQWSYSHSSGKWGAEVVHGKQLEVLRILKEDIENFVHLPDGECFARLAAFRKEVDPDDYMILMSRYTRRTLATDASE